MNERLAALETHFAARANDGKSAQEQVVGAQQSSYGTDSPVGKLATLQSKMQSDAAMMPQAPEPEKEVVSANVPVISPNPPNCRSKTVWLPECG